MAGQRKIPARFCLWCLQELPRTADGDTLTCACGVAYSAATVTSFDAQRWARITNRQGVEVRRDSDDPSVLLITDHHARLRGEGPRLTVGPAEEPKAQAPKKATRRSKS